MCFPSDNTLHLHSGKSLYVLEVGIYIKYITYAQSMYFINISKLMQIKKKYLLFSVQSPLLENYCKKKLNSLKHLVRTTVAESHN